MEQLNITIDSVDLFRASSRILKAGVQAGLTLYDIAVMCCRNDDLGEIPSKLEILYSMAEELSLSALENGRWHHSAASRALAEQLSPRGGPLIPTRRSSISICHSGTRSGKSSSCVQFKSMVSDLETDLVEDDPKKDYPGMAQSSASDSSSEAGDVVTEKEECDEWAATLLTNISMQRSMSLVQKEERSSSIGSEDDSNDPNGSPKGFWHTRPGSPSLRSVDDDDESWNLSPESSPVHQVELASAPENSFPPLPEAPLSVGGVFKRESSRTHCVHFADDAWLNKELEVPSTRLSEIGGIQMEKTELKLALSIFPKVDGGRLKRSQSYSAISVPARSSMSLSFLMQKHVRRHPDPCTKEYEQYRDYFIKFVELVIVRETKAATVLSQVNQAAG